MRISPLRPLGGALLGLVTIVTTPSAAQDYSVLRINEVIADNRTQSPVDIGGGHPDMVEILNTGGEDLIIGFAADAGRSLALSDSPTQPMEGEQGNLPQDHLYVFSEKLDPARDTVILAGQSILVFCDGNTAQNSCEPHTPFNIDSDGGEPITLWGPADPDGKREILDQVWLPPLRRDVSFGRFPHGAGPAPVPVEDTFQWFRYHPPDLPGTLPDQKTGSTFGTCPSVPNTNCWEDNQVRFCRGDENNAGANLAPRVSRESHSTNGPAAGEAVEFTLRVRDDEAPVPPNIARVRTFFRVIEGGVKGSWESVEMTHDAAAGLQSGASIGRPLDRWSLWRGSIPGQNATTRVEFYFEVEDQHGATATRPLVLCAEGVGPCDREFGDFAIQGRLDQTLCQRESPDSDRFVPCETPFTYAVGYAPRGNFESLVINEVVASQMHDPANGIAGILKDPTSNDDLLCSFRAPGSEEPPKYCCTADDLSPSCGYDDFIEIHNTSTTEIVDLSGLWLSDRAFTPVIWRFPPGSRILPGEYLIVWLDDDGGKCPNRFASEMPRFWECPDPSAPGDGLYHASFELSAENDQIYLRDTEANDFGIIHAVEFGGLTPNVSWSLCPDGDRSGAYREVPGGTPEGPNPSTDCPEPPGQFRRGDANNDGRLDISDGISTLSFLFQGGPRPDCDEAANFNGDFSLDISDAVTTFNFLFLGGLPPPPPHPTCGVDPAGASCPGSVCNNL